MARRRGVRARVAQLFASLAPIQRGELTTVVLLTINVFVLLTCYYVLKVVREPLTTRAAKYKAKAAIDTFFFRAGDVIAGLGIVFLLVRVLGLGIRAFAVLNVCLAVCWIVLAYRTGQMYDEMAADHVEPEAHPGQVAA